MPLFYVLNLDQPTHVVLLENSSLKGIKLQGEKIEKLGYNVPYLCAA